MRSPLPLWQVFFLLALPAGPAVLAEAPEVEIRMVLQVHGEGGAKATEAQVARTAEVLASRLDQAGADDPVVTTNGDRVSVRAGGIDDPDRIRRLLLSNAKLEFRFISFPKDGSGAASREAVLQSYGGNLPPDVEILEGDQRADDGRKTGSLYYAVEKERAAGGEDFESVRPGMGQFGTPMLSFKLNPEAASVFGEKTGANVGRSLAIVLNGKVVSNPVVRARITDRGQIEGNFTQEEAQELAAVLNSGGLTAPVTVLEETRGSSPRKLNKTASTALFVLIAILAFLAAGGVFSRRKKRPLDGGTGQG
jgi:preprotein translocase subunit SecD